MAQSTIFALPVGSARLVYAPLARRAAIVTRRALDELERILSADPLGPEAPAPRSEVAALARLLRAGAQPPEPKAGPFDPRFVGLVTTRGCDMECVYCDFRPAAAQRPMSHELADAALRWMAAQAQRRKLRSLEVNLFGGEPFATMPLVRQLAARARTLAGDHGLEPRLSACTNGTFSPESAEWIARSFSTIVLSFEGSPEAQNRDRPLRGRPEESFARVDATARILSRGPARLVVRMCVHAGTVEGLPGRVADIARRHRPRAVVIAPLRHAGPEDGLSPPEPGPLVRAFADASTAAEPHDVEVVYGPAELTRRRSTYCPVGDDGFVVSPDGGVSACYQLGEIARARGLEPRFGTLASDGSLSLDLHALAALRARVVQNEPRCRRCFCRWHCAGGCRLTDTPPGAAAGYTPFCEQTRAITLWQLLRGFGEDPLATELARAPTVTGDVVLGLGEGVER